MLDPLSGKVSDVVPKKITVGRGLIAVSDIRSLCVLKNQGTQTDLPAWRSLCIARSTLQNPLCVLRLCGLTGVPRLFLKISTPLGPLLDPSHRLTVES